MLTRFLLFVCGGSSQDLGTIEKKLIATDTKLANCELGAADAVNEMSDDAAQQVSRSDVYGSPEEFASDVRMVWRNTHLYNKPALEVYQFARALSIKFEEWFAML